MKKYLPFILFFVSPFVRAGSTLESAVVQARKSLPVGVYRGTESVFGSREQCEVRVESMGLRQLRVSIVTHIHGPVVFDTQNGLSMFTVKGEVGEHRMLTLEGPQKRLILAEIPGGGVNVVIGSTVQDNDYVRCDLR